MKKISILMREAALYYLAFLFLTGVVYFLTLNPALNLFNLYSGYNLGLAFSIPYSFLLHLVHFSLFFLLFMQLKESGPKRIVSGLLLILLVGTLSFALFSTAMILSFW